ncbi:hypothetical protein HRbin29_00467 [bacterium HR29]|nr:hypothetical protein HRbin29_00467 [bacterium HR29]
MPFIPSLPTAAFTFIFGYSSIEHRHSTSGPSLIFPLEVPEDGVGFDAAAAAPDDARVRPGAQPSLVERAAPSAVLLAGVLAISWAAIFVRLAGEAPALTIAAVRMAVGAAVVVAAAAWWTRRQGAVSDLRRSAPWFAAGGVILAGHFWSWFASLERTSVGSSVMIIGLQPLLASAMAYVWLSERPTHWELVGMAMAAVGLAVIGAGDLGGGRDALTGDALALLGALLGAAYRTLGRAARPSLGALEYSAGVYTVAAVLLWALAAATGARTSGFAPETWGWLLALAVVSQVVGHTALNWALGRFRVATVSLVAQAEPVLATLLAVPVLGEPVGTPVAAGGPLIVGGVALALAKGSADQPPRREAPTTGTYSPE